MFIPHAVFEGSFSQWAFLTALVDTDFEGESLDRTEAGLLA
jgi:hypothetical protein